MKVPLSTDTVAVLEGMLSHADKAWERAIAEAAPTPPTIVRLKKSRLEAVEPDACEGSMSTKIP
ncbi:hypothetical protein RA989_21525, partial [Mycobacteroides abscessus subsp. massiliense]